MLLDRIVNRYLPFALALWLTLLVGASAETGLGGGGVGSTGLGWNRGGTSVTNDQQFIMIDNTPDASAERKLAVSLPLALTDGGANAAITIGLGTVPGTLGGTGHATSTVGDLLVGASSNAWAKLGLGNALEVLRVNAAGTNLEYAPAGTGSVTDFSAGDLSPLFTTSEANTTTTPALTFSLSNAAANTVLGNFTGSPAGPTYGTVTIAAGGTGQTTKAAAFDALSPLTTEGDLLGYTTTNARIAKGTGNQVLGMNNGATAQEYKTITAGTNISVAHGAGTITINNTDPNNGTVTNYSAGDLSPLFTTTEANTTTTPALSFALTDAAAYTVLGRHAASTGAPSYGALTTAHLPNILGGTTASSIRALPTSGTLTGEYWHVGDWTTTNTITCNRCRWHVLGNVTISHTITVNTEMPGGVASTAAYGAGTDGGGISGGGGGVWGYNGSSAYIQAGGGGGNGGAGGRGGGYSGAGAAGGGITYYENFLPGSGGGAGANYGTATAGSGGAGGGALLIEASGNITVSAGITAVGGNGTNGTAIYDQAGGGGAGGTVAMICGGNWTLSAATTINVSGGNGGNGGSSNAGGGGGGGGGRCFARAGGTATNSGTVTVSGGSAGTTNATATAAAAGSAGSSDIAGSTAYSVRTAP